MDLEQQKKLVSEAKSDPLAFGRLFDEYYRPILNYCVRRVGDIEIGQDITSEVFFKAYRKLWQFTWRSVPFSAWLYRIANHEIANYFRGRKIEISLEELTDSGFQIADRIDLLKEIQIAQEVLEHHQEYLRILAELKKLPLKYQEVVALRFFENKQITEIAEILGKKEGTVKSLLFRAIQMIKKNLTSEEISQPVLVSRVVVSKVDENN